LFRYILKKNTIKILSALIILTVFFAAGCTRSGENQQEYITIGVLLPLTGADSDEGLRALNGLQLAKEEINAAGGVLGKKLDFVVLNDRGDEEYIVKQYKILSEKGIAAIIGSSYSNVTLALAIASEKDGIPVISPTASNIEVTRGRRNVFRAIFTDDYQAEAMAHFAAETLNAKTAVVLSQKDSGNYSQIADFFAKSFAKAGGSVLAVESYSSENDFSGILRKYSGNHPDVIFYPGDYTPAAKLINMSYEAGFKNTYLLGSDSWDGLLSYVFQPDALKNVFYTAPFSFDDHDEDVTRFVTNYFESYSQMPLSGSATSYSCVYILAEAIKKAGTTNKDDIIASLKEIDMDVITGRIKFDENNTPRSNVYIIKIEGGEYSSFLKLNL